MEKDYTRCLECRAVFPSSLEITNEDEEPICPICRKPAIVSLTDIDVEQVIDDFERKDDFHPKSLADIEALRERDDYYPE